MIYILPITYIILFTTHARDPDLAINMGAMSDHELVKGQNLWTKSIPSPSSKTAPPERKKNITSQLLEISITGAQ